ncbi:hypothetical protein JN531_017210 (plasmid) [Flagellatimonas centrodinii]|uniref:nucleotide kinase domain-containing protein n=1 Tax=Flagellatimonas centrodinii TaxID=2806210 RepID=UPI001FED7179|nr:nucleotide kinase domain-containing protein [Flagellatimonas centrodinii]ULQ48372.1 hypothetical protein JN531_017210 [Flagellatimonas centrodinii]
MDSELNIFLRWIHEREAIRKRRAAGEPWPWTDDPFLRAYRWCNVRRMDDRVSRALFERWYRPGSGVREDLHRALLGRLVNWPDSLDEIGSGLENARAVLASRAATGAKVWTGAYVVPGVQGQAKVDSICDLVDRVVADGDRVVRSTMRSTWRELVRFDGMGSFLAGQVVADLAHLPLGARWPDVTTWAPIGPGSARGINRLRGIPKDKPVPQEQFEQLLPDLIGVVRPLIGEIWIDRGLHAMDIQNCLCEYDKYRRLQLGEGTVRARYVPTGTAAGQGSLFG